FGPHEAHAREHRAPLSYFPIPSVLPAPLRPEAPLRHRCRRRRPPAGPTRPASLHPPAAPSILEASRGHLLALLGGRQGSASSFPWPPPSTRRGALPTSPSASSAPGSSPSNQDQFLALPVELLAMWSASGVQAQASLSLATTCCVKYPQEIQNVLYALERALLAALIVKELGFVPSGLKSLLLTNEPPVDK
ncbi:unnamed protein product, partial [Urochloa humidicola]